MHLKNERGQSLIEYVILVALVAVATMGMVRVLQKTISVNLAEVVSSLQPNAKRQKFQHDQIRATDLRQKDFSNFWSNTHARSGGGDAGGDE